MLLTLCLALLTPAAAGPQARKAAAAPPSLALEGDWVGEEIGAVGSLHPMITLTRDGGTIAYADSSGGTGQLKMRLQAVKVEGTQVHFAVPRGGRLKHYSGRWDGRRISGTISADAAGTQPIGTFELRRPVYDGAPRSAPSAAVSADASPEDTAAEAPEESTAPARQPARAEATPAPASQIEREREAGKKRLEKRLDKISDDATRMELGIGLWHTSCRDGDGVGPAMDCDDLVREIGRLGFAVSRGLDDAEEEARRSWLEPGTVR